MLDPNSALQIELVRRQYSGNAHAVIKGIGVVTCVYINPDLNPLWIMDGRIYDPQGDGKSKLDHVRQMLDNALSVKRLPFRGMLMDSWDAEGKLMLPIEDWKKVYYCPLKSNRLLDDSDQQQPYQRIDTLSWTVEQQQRGKALHVKGFPKRHRVKLFRLAFSTERTDYMATNDLAHDSTHDTQAVCALPWKLEQFHRETKQTTRLSMAAGTDSTQSYCLCHPGVDPTQTSCPGNGSRHLSTQAGPVG